MVIKSKDSLRGKTSFWIIACIVFPMCVFSGSATLSWDANTEPDLAGYQIHYGTHSGVYSVILDVGNVTEYEISALPMGATYHFAVTAYDLNGNVSEYSEEVVYTIEDDIKPTIVSARLAAIDQVLVIFSEHVKKASAEQISNYGIDKGIVVQSAVLQDDFVSVLLTTNQHANDLYTLTVNNVSDCAPVPNVILPNSTASYQWQGSDLDKPKINWVELTGSDFIRVRFSEPIEPVSAKTLSNYNIVEPKDIGEIQIRSISVSDDFLFAYLTTDRHTASDQLYFIEISGVKDVSLNQMDPVTIQYRCASENKYAPEIISVRTRSATEVEVEFSETVEKASAETVGHYSIENNISIYAAAHAANKVTLTTSPHASGNYILTVQNIHDVETPVKTLTSGQATYAYTAPDETPPALVVAAISSETQIRVEFSEAMDAATATRTSNYVITNGVSVSSAFLDNAGTNVYLTTTAHEAGNYTLTVNNVKDLAGNVIASSHNSKDYSWVPVDRTPPVLQSVTYQTSQILLQFSEELDRTSAEIESNYAISPSIAISDAVLFGEHRDQVVLKTGSFHAIGQTYVVTVQHVKDKAYNMIQSGDNTASYTVPNSDNIAPVVAEVKINGTESVQIRFSEPVTEATASAAANYTISGGIQVRNVYMDLVSRQVVFLATSAHEAGGQYAIQVAGVKDLAGNTVAANQNTYTLPANDASRPLVEYIEMLDDDVVNIIFSKALDPVSAETASNYQIDGGIRVEKATLSRTYREVRLNTTSHNAGLYRLTVKHVRDQSAAANAIAEVTREYSYYPSTTEPPNLVSVQLTTPYTLELRFDRAMEPASAEDISHYALNNGMRLQSAKLDRTGLVVTLTTVEEHVPGSYAVTVSGVKDGLYGNVLNEGLQPYARQISDDEPPRIANAYLSGAGTLIVTFTERIDPASAQNKANYAISPGKAIENVYINGHGESSVVIVTEDHAPGEYTLTVNGVKDLSGNAVPAYSQHKYPWNPDDDVAPELVRVTPMSNDYLEVEFSEPVNKDDAKTVGNYTISPELSVISAIPDATNLSKVYLRTEPHDPASYQLTVGNVRDCAFTPNVIGAKNTITYHFVPSDTSAPKIVSVEARTQKSIKLVFDEPVSRAMAENVASYRITPAVEIRGANLYANLTTVFLETGEHHPGVHYTFEVRQMADRAPNPNAIKQSLTRAYSFSPPDTKAPELLSVKLQSTLTTVQLIFDEMLDPVSAEDKSNYTIDPNIEIRGATIDGSYKRVDLETTMHMPGVYYTLYVQGVRDRADVPNAMSLTEKSYGSLGGSSVPEAPQVAWIEPVSSTQIDVIFTKPVDKAAAEKKDNYFIDNTVRIQGAVRDSNLVRVHLTTSEHEMRQAYTIQIADIKANRDKTKIMSGPASISYIMAGGMALSNVNQTNTALCAFGHDRKSYTDRDYTLVHVPDDLANALRIITANDDKTNPDLNYLTFDITGAAKCYVAYDTQIDSIPDWLKAFRATGKHVVDSRENVFALYEKIYSEGRVSLGGNCGTLDDNNYMVFITPQKASGSLVSNLSKAGYQLAYVNVGDAYYVDREYTLSSLPDTLKDCLWMKTANEDKTERDTDFLTFRVKDPSRIYVAYDAKMAAIPTWMTDWAQLDAQVVDSRGVRFNVIAKEVAAGDVTLGGNCGSMDDNMYLVLLRAVDRDNIYASLPGHFTLGQNYPNPFNPITNIKYIVHKPGHIKLAVYNVMGQQVKLLVDQELDPGEYTEQWNAVDERGLPVSSGVYLYRIQQGDFAKTQRMLLIR